MAGTCKHVNVPSGAIKLVANLGMSDPAEVYTMRHCTVPLDLTSRSGSFTLYNAWNIWTSWEIVSYSRSLFHGLS